MTTAKFWQIPYNNWRWSERCAVIPIQEEAFRTGRAVRPTTCLICGFVGIGKREGRWQIIAHLERYDRPLDFYSICRPCHNALHGRFTNPARWQRLLQRYPRPGKWYMLLSMNPASQLQPFEQTYARGLPEPVSVTQLQLPKED